MGISVLPPDVNESFENFTVTGEAIRFGLAAVKNVGLGAVEAILVARKTDGPFASLGDLVGRVDSHAANRRVLESLVKAGALDSLGAPRAQMLQTLDDAMEAAQLVHRARASGQTGLFDLAEGATPIEESPAAPVEEFSKEELLAMEKEMLGLYISDHPLRHVHDVMATRINAPLSELVDLPDKTLVTVGGIVTAVKRATTRGGSAMAFVTLEDLTGSCEVIIFPKIYEQVHFLLKRDAVIVVRGKVDIAEQQAKLLADRVLTLEDAEEVAPLPVLVASASANGDGDTAGDSPPATRAPGALHVRVDAGQLGEEGLHRLKEMLGRRHGDLPVLLHVRASDREVVMDARDLRVAASAELQAELETLLGAGAVWQD
jgi:DNA polymerase-3 subunit alpha